MKAMYFSITSVRVQSALRKWVPSFLLISGGVVSQRNQARPNWERKKLDRPTYLEIMPQRDPVWLAYSVSYSSESMQMNVVIP